jgi:hypothetical protein
MADFETLCPHCHSRLKIDTDVQAIIDFTPSEEPRTFENLDAAVGNLKKSDAERDARFQIALDSEKGKKDVLQKKFDGCSKAQNDTSNRSATSISLMAGSARAHGGEDR